MILIVALLALNFWVSSEVLGPNPRVQIPYSPTFLNEVNNKNVSAISSTGASIQGTFKKAVKYPADSTSAATTVVLLDPDPVVRQRHAAVQHA